VAIGQGELGFRPGLVRVELGRVNLNVDFFLDL
jgi:hypothetical protein